MKNFNLMSLVCILAVSSYGWAQNTNVEANQHSGQNVQKTTQWSGVHLKETATPNTETISGEVNNEIPIDLSRMEIPYFGAYGHGRPDGTDGFEENLIYTNGPLVDEGAGSSLSIVDADAGMNSIGFGAQKDNNNSMADDFVLTEDFDISEIAFYVYQTGATSASITEVTIQIWNDNPATGGSILWGDLSTDILDDVEFTDIKRVMSHSQTDETRILQRVTANTSGLSLSAGTYWVEAVFDGSESSGPWVPPITVQGETITGDAMQFTGNTNGTWQAAVDSGTADPQGMPFEIYGTLSGSGDGCMEINPHYDWFFDIGYGVSSNFSIANDITLDAGTDFELQSMNLTLACEYPITDLDLVYYEDDNGKPGSQIGSEISPTIVSVNAIGSITGYPIHNVYSVEVEVSPFQFLGDESNETTYWIAIQDAESGQNESVFWMATAGNNVGNESYQRKNQEAWTNKDDYDGIYTFRGECSDVLGVNENEAVTLQIYPNPATDVIQLSAGSQIGTVLLFNMLGQEILRTETESTTAEVNISHLPAGTYILKNVIGDRSESHKLIKK